MKLSKSAISRPYIYPLLMSVSSLIIFYLLRYSDLNYQGLETLFAGVCTASLASYITVVLVDRTFREQKQKRQQKMRKTAFRELSGTINSHIGLLSDMYIATMPEYPKDSPDEYDQLFDKKFASQIQLLDFSKKYPTARGGVMWFNYSENELNNLKETIDQVLSKYSPWLNAETTNNLRELKQSTFVSMLISLSEANLIQLDNQKGYDRTYTVLAGNVDIILEHTNVLLEIIEEYEEIDGVELTDVQDFGAWSENVAPQPESAIIPEEELLKNDKKQDE